ncbi:MAG: hypothetical protein JO145_07145, partial [Acidobacteriaceae bacterium]|nr:hypothetical protein [Acidobacteriaceae bacterium]
MNRTLAFVTALMSLGIAADLRAGEKNLNRQVSFEGMPLSFEPNVGQAEAGAKFVAHGAGYEVQLDPSRAQFRFGSKAHESRTVTMHLAGDRGDAEMAGEALLPGKANYLPTKNPNTWHTNIPTYSRVRYTGVYPGVDLAFYGNPSRLEYDFVVQPDADVAAIGLKFSGADQVNLDASGDLLLRLGKGDIRFLKPVAYQTSLDGKRREPVEAGYQLHKSASGEPALISFSIGRYDHARRLVIDPVAVPSLIYSEYVSGYAAAVTVDSSGNTYVTGQNLSGNGFYVTKFSSTGTVVYNSTVG